MKKGIKFALHPLGELCEVTGGNSAPQGESHFRDGTIPFVRMRDLGRYHHTTSLIETRDAVNETAISTNRLKIFEPGCILFPRSGSVALNHRAILAVRACIVSHIGILHSFSSEIDVRYLYWTLVQYDMRAIAKQTTGLDLVGFSDVKNIPIPVPATMEEQRQIVAEIEKQFTRLDAGIAALRRTQANLKRYRVAVLKAACEGWPSCPLSSVCEVVSGYAFRSSDFCDTGIPVVKIANVSYGSFSDDTPSFLPRNFLPEFHRFTVRAGDILLALTRPITNNQVKTCLYPKELPEALLNQRVAKLVPTDRIVRGYLLAYLRSEHFKSAITARMPQTLQPNLSPRDLSAMPIPLPPFDEQTRIVAEVERRLSVVEELEAVLNANLQRATRLRQSILSKAFSQ